MEMTELAKSESLHSLWPKYGCQQTVRGRRYTAPPECSFSSIHFTFSSLHGVCPAWSSIQFLPEILDEQPNIMDHSCFSTAVSLGEMYPFNPV